MIKIALYKVTTNGLNRMCYLQHCLFLLHRLLGCSSHRSCCIRIEMGQ